MDETAKSSPGRIAMLDWVRGFAMFFIAGGEVVVLALAELLPGKPRAFLAEQMGHVAWEGCAFYDVIFPTFLLISGASFACAWARSSAQGGARWGRLALRTLCLVVLGVIYNGALEQSSLSAIRFPSVLARIGLGVFLAAIPYACLSKGWRLAFFPLGLAAYAGLFAWCGGAEAYVESGNWAGKVDEALLPGAVNGLDPEGVISTLGALLTAYLGMLLGDFMRSPIARKALWLAAGGGLLLGLAWGFSPWVPIIKRLWTASYVCCAGGWTLLICAAFQLVAETLRPKRALGWLSFIGAHALWFYFLPRFVDFRAVAWKVVGGVTQACDAPRAVQGIVWAVAGFGALYLTVWALRRRA